jgi:hypothetical protein
MMNPCRVQNVMSLILLAGLIDATGCASKRPPLSETLMTKTPTIGVVLRLRDPDMELQMPRKPILRKLTLRKDWLGNAGREALNGSAIYGAVSAEPVGMGANRVGLRGDPSRS